MQLLSSSSAFFFAIWTTIALFHRFVVGLRLLHFCPLPVRGSAASFEMQSTSFKNIPSLSVAFFLGARTITFLMSFLKLPPVSKLIWLTVQSFPHSVVMCIVNMFGPSIALWFVAWPCLMFPINFLVLTVKSCSFSWTRFSAKCFLNLFLFFSRSFYISQSSYLYAAHASLSSDDFACQQYFLLSRDFLSRIQIHLSPNLWGFVLLHDFHGDKSAFHNL